ncbi:MAG: hypothetical protein QMC74_00840 [Myxococcota bacterium]
MGSHAEAAAAVLGNFLAGLSIGYGVFGRSGARRVRAGAAGGRPARLLGRYGGVEIGIGLYAFAFPMLFAGIESLLIAMPIEDSALRFFVDVMLTVDLIGPSAVMMGATVPFLTQALPMGMQEASRLHAQVYARNTIGGAFVRIVAIRFREHRFGLRIMHRLWEPNGWVGSPD